MRRLFIFLLSLVSMLGAHAGENVLPDSQSVTAEVQGVRSVNPASPALLQLPAAPSMPTPPLVGNPLQSVPLSTLSETRSRPLFSVTRRPPPAILVSAPASTALVEVQATEPEPFALVGTILSSNARLAVLLDRTTNRMKQLRQGKVDSGWTVLSVDPRSIVLQKGEQLRTVAFPRPNVALAQSIARGDAR